MNWQGFEYHFHTLLLFFQNLSLDKQPVL